MKIRLKGLLLTIGILSLSLAGCLPGMYPCDPGTGEEVPSWATLPCPEDMECDAEITAAQQCYEVFSYFFPEGGSMTFHGAINLRDPLYDYFCGWMGRAGDEVGSCQFPDLEP